MPTPRPPRRTGGRRSRTKGVRAEREIVRFLHDAGIAAERVPLSGAAGGRFRDDVILGDGRRAEVKIRRSGLSLLYRLLGDQPGPVTVDPTSRGASQVDKWLGTADVLFVRTNRAGWLVIERHLGMLHVQTLERWITAYRGREGGRAAA